MHPIPFSYNFPPIKQSKVKEEDLIEKLHEELAEVDDALETLKGEEYLRVALKTLMRLDANVYPSTFQTAYDHLLEEILDLYHATETIMRIFPPEKVFAMRNKVIEKNARRGYYEED